MQVVRKPARVFLEIPMCDCGKGVLKATGNVVTKPKSPPSIEYRCDGCGTMVLDQVAYPKISYEVINIPAAPQPTPRKTRKTSGRRA